MSIFCRLKSGEPCVSMAQVAVMYAVRVGALLAGAWPRQESIKPGTTIH